MRRLALMVALTSSLMGAAYLARVSGEGNQLSWPALLVSTLIVLPGLVACAGALVAPVGGRGLLAGWSVFGFLAIALMSAASIGFALLPLAMAAAVLGVLSLSRQPRWYDWLGALPGGVVGIGFVAAYIVGLPYLPPSCPTRATAGGVITYPAGSIYSREAITIVWTCAKGRLVSYSRTP